jgi:RHS repeat-associated protein
MAWAAWRLRISMVHRTTGQSVAAVTDDLGIVLRREEFTAFGASKARSQATSVGPTGGWEEGFHGIRADELMVAGGRAYDSERGSWLSRDPLAMGSPAAVLSDVRIGARYGFNHGNPYAFRDPSGRMPDDYSDEQRLKVWVEDAENAAAEAACAAADECIVIEAKPPNDNTMFGTLDEEIELARAQRAEISYWNSMPGIAYMENYNAGGFWDKFARFSTPEEHRVAVARGNLSAAFQAPFLAAGMQGARLGKSGGGGNGPSPLTTSHPSQRAAMRAAQRDAGMGSHGARSTVTVPLSPGSRSPQGAPGVRTEVTNPYNGQSYHHDPYGHNFEGQTIGPHYGVEKTSGETMHHLYPSDHDPTTNR